MTIMLVKQKRVPVYLDRYPAKMVPKLADKIMDLYLEPGSSVLDPFCGSGSILMAAKRYNASVIGLDINPYAILLSSVKLEGFDFNFSNEILNKLISKAEKSTDLFPVSWNNKDYWFTKTTLNKYERLRYIAREMDLNQTKNGRAVLLAFALSIRLCSRADQKSPKPFISKIAIKDRKGIHFDPYSEIKSLLKKLGSLYGKTIEGDVALYRQDCKNLSEVKKHILEPVNYAITSPPYINAQDYFRNSKLELYMLQGLIPFDIKSLTPQFIGTERGNLLAGIPASEIQYYHSILPELEKITEVNKRLSFVIHRYLHDMSLTFDTVKSCLAKSGFLIVVCGDNIVANQPIATWEILNKIIELKGFKLIETFGDPIACRSLPPSRKGHQSIIKSEIVSTFKLIG